MNKMKNRPSALAGLGAELAVDATPAPSPSRTEGPAAQAVENESGKLKPIGTNFRMTPMDWDRLKDLSKAERRSLQEIIEEGLNAVFAKRGLPPLQGMPRAKSKNRD